MLVSEAVLLPALHLLLLNVSLLNSGAGVLSLVLIHDLLLLFQVGANDAALLRVLDHR